MLIVSVLIAGCATFPTASEHEIGYSGQIGVTNGSFHMDGEFFIAQGTASDITFRDTRVVIYDDQRRVLEQLPVGDISTDPDVAPFRRPVNFTSEHIPAYIIYESPDFWKDNDVPTRAFKWTGEEYHRYSITDPEEKFNS